MSMLHESDMRAYLSRSISSLNSNKLNGLLAEVDFRAHLINLGFGSRVSRGGWIARRVGANQFAHKTAVFFPETIHPETNYSGSRTPPSPDNGLHTICSTFHQTGIEAYFCSATITTEADANSVVWKAIQLGVPTVQPYRNFPECVENLFTRRARKYNFLRYKTDTTSIPSSAIAEEFSKENLRIALSKRFLTEISDVDGILWGERNTYPLEIKEKTVVANDRRLGDYFGLDVGPFVKLAYYAARRGNLHSLFIVREINNIETRDLVQWWFITFDRLSQFASWSSRGGGRNMQGGMSSVVCIPKAEFSPLTRDGLTSL